MISRSCVKVKVMGQRSRSQCKKRDFQGLPIVYLMYGQVQGQHVKERAFQSVFDT